METLQILINLVQNIESLFIVAICVMIVVITQVIKECFSWKLSRLFVNLIPFLPAFILSFPFCLWKYGLNWIDIIINMFAYSMIFWVLSIFLYNVIMKYLMRSRNAKENKK